MDPNAAKELAELDARWQDRELLWSRKLRRLHLKAEPIEEQLERYRRVNWGLTVVPSLIGLIFIALFSVFGRPDVGLILVGVLLLPIILWSWFDFTRLESSVRAYQKERANYEDERSRLEDPLPQTATASGQI